jgi:hypothetical protein
MKRKIKLLIIKRLRDHLLKFWAIDGKIIKKLIKAMSNLNHKKENLF